jgi:thioredoxin reductase (NADPH)
MQERARANPKISFIWNSDVVEIHDTEGKVSSVTLRNVKTNALTKHEIDGVFIGIGHQPNTKLFEGQLPLDLAGYIVTQHGTMTEIPGVFAAGDVQDRIYRQAVTAAGSGCMAALDAERYLEGLKHAPGPNTAVMRLEELRTPLA